jgi:chromosome segregation and condensation protein ScpB
MKYELVKDFLSIPKGTVLNFNIYDKDEKEHMAKYNEEGSSSYIQIGESIVEKHPDCFKRVEPLIKIKGYGMVTKQQAKKSILDYIHQAEKKITRDEYETALNLLYTNGIIRAHLEALNEL